MYYNVTLRRVHKTIVAWKSNKYYIFVCVCMLERACVRAPGRVVVCIRIRAYNLANPARNAYAPCCDVICGPSVSTIFLGIMS